VEKERFITLLRLGLDYNREQGTFSISNCNQIEKLSVALAEILSVEDVTFAQTCAVCGANFPCKDCRYLDQCATKNLPFECVCAPCLEKKSAKEHL
jgi:hypothetical protein